MLMVLYNSTILIVFYVLFSVIVVHDVCCAQIKSNYVKVDEHNLILV